MAWTETTRRQYCRDKLRYALVLEADSHTLTQKSKLNHRAAEHCLRFIVPETRHGPMCSNISSGSTIRAGATRRSAISVLWNSNGWQLRIKVRVHQTDSSSVHTILAMNTPTPTLPPVASAMSISVSFFLLKPLSATSATSSSSWRGLHAVSFVQSLGCDTPAQAFALCDPAPTYEYRTPLG